MKEEKSHSKTSQNNNPCRWGDTFCVSFLKKEDFGRKYRINL